MLINAEMKVELLAHTNVLELPAKAAKFCTSTASLSEIMQPDLYDDAILRRVLSLGHESIVEHFSATFGISGVSRVTETQLVRHRVASYSIKSGRYTMVGDNYEVVIPKSLKGKFVKTTRQPGNDNTLSAGELMGMCHDFYRALVANGVPQEDARYILPQATATQIMVTMNARELLHFFQKRLCKTAQWEIRAVATRMLEICKELQPAIFDLAGPTCEATGYCTEHTSKHCGRKPHKSEVLR